MSTIVGLQPEFKSWHILNPRLALVLFGMMQISLVGLKIFFFLAGQWLGKLYFDNRKLYGKTHIIYKLHV